jgi:MFS family permease
VATGSTRELTKVTIAAGFGGIIEYYDFFIASFAAATVWPQVFFPDLSSGVADAFSILTFGLVYFTRPIGAYIFGHFGDRIGRKKTLIFTLFAMGLGLLGIALTPSYGSIGWIAIALVVLFRLLFGIGLGGEYGGAVSWITEFTSRSRSRPFWNLWATPVPIGLLLASLTFSYLASSMNGSFITFGWRIPFAIGAVLVVIGLLIRFRVSESPAFKIVLEKKALDKAPASKVLKLYLKTILLLSLAWTFMTTLTSAVMVPFSVSYLVTIGVSSQLANLYVTYAVILGVFIMFLGFVISERLGRKKTMILSALWGIVASIAFFPLLNTSSPVLIVLADTLLFGCTVFCIGAQNTLFAESFPTKFRYSGSGLSFQFGTLISGVVIVGVIPAIILRTGSVINSWPYVSLVGALVATISLVALFFVRETGDSEILDK